MEGVTNLGRGVVGGIGTIASTAGSAIEGSTALAKKSTDVALKLGSKSVDAAGVLGSATIDAASAIGSKGVEAASSVATGAIGATDKIANAALDASATVAAAATDTAAAAATVSADVTKETISKTGDVLKSGVKTAATIAETGLNGVRRVAELTAQKGELAATKIEAATSAQKKAFEDMGRQRLNREQAVKEFKQSASEVRTGIGGLISIQKTVLAANIHMYRKAKCGWVSRTFGTCPVKVTDDINTAKRIATVFLNDLDRATADALSKLSTGKDGGNVIDEYLRKTGELSDAFQAEFSKLIEKYRGLADGALSTSGGRRKKTYRRRSTKKPKRASSRRRPSVRGSSF